MLRKLELAVKLRQDEAVLESWGQRRNVKKLGKSIKALQDKESTGLELSTGAVSPVVSKRLASGAAPTNQIMQEKDGQVPRNDAQIHQPTRHSDRMHPSTAGRIVVKVSWPEIFKAIAMSLVPNKAVRSEQHPSIDAPILRCHAAPHCQNNIIPYLAENPGISAAHTIVTPPLALSSYPSWPLSTASCCMDCLCGGSVPS